MRLGIWGIYLPIILFEEVEEAANEQESGPSAVLLAEQATEDGVPLAEAQRLRILDSCRRLVANMGNTTVTEAHLPAGGLQEGAGGGMLHE